MKILKVNRIKDGSIGMDVIEVEIDDDGIIRTECFDGSDYWLELIDGKERFKSRLFENKLNIDKFNKDKPKKSNENIRNELIKFRGDEI